MPDIINKSAPLSSSYQAISESFTEIEMMDEIVRYIYVNASTMKRLILDMPNEINFDYIPNGVGYLRTAYLKFHPGLCDNVFKFATMNDTVVLRLELKPY